MEGTPESTQQKPVLLGGGRVGALGRGLADLPATRLDSRPDPTSQPRPPVLLSVPRRAHPWLCNLPPGPSAARLAAALQPGLGASTHGACSQLCGCRACRGWPTVRVAGQSPRPRQPSLVSPRGGRGGVGAARGETTPRVPLAASVSAAGPASSPVSFLLSHAVYTQRHALA